MDGKGKAARPRALDLYRRMVGNRTGAPTPAQEDYAALCEPAGFFDGTADELRAVTDPYIKEFIS